MIGGTRYGRPVFRLQALAAERHVVYLGGPGTRSCRIFQWISCNPAGVDIGGYSAPHVEPFAPENGLVTILTRDGCFMAFVT